jgi:membrane-bound ClpP family serine protease
MENYEPHRKGKKAVMLFVFGLILVLVRLYTQWDVWVVIGVLLMVKAVLMALMSLCCRAKGEKKK